MTKTILAGARRGQRGATLIVVALSLVILLGISALAIDLVSLYVARSEAQRAADAAALAGADVFVKSGFTVGLVTQAQVQNLARDAAVAAGNKNLVGGQNPIIQSGDVTFDFSIAGDPRITVVVQRTAARSSAMPTFFAKIFGKTTADVSAQATAEAYNPSGGGPPVGTKCLKPWILPNCDPNPAHTTPANSNCPGTSAYFVNSACNSNPNAPGVCYPGSVNSGGVIGQQLTLKVGDPSLAPAPGQFYPVDIPAGVNPALCPGPSSVSCGSLTGGGGGALYRQNIACCNTNNIVCGDVAVNWETGNMQGPTQQGTECLIHASNEGLGQGQDTINISTTPFNMTGGNNNPNPSLRGLSGLSSSDSLVTVPLYNGTTPCPGHSCGASVQIVGFLQLFVEQETPRNDPVCSLCVKATVVGISGCGGGGGGTPVIGGGFSAIPVRLIQPGN